MSMTATLDALAYPPGGTKLLYRNHRGEVAVRAIHPQAKEGHGSPLWFGTTKWHPEPQWLLHAVDVEKGTARDFAMAGILAWGADPLAAYTGRSLADAVNMLVAAAHGASSAAGWWTDPDTGTDLSEQRFFPYVVGTKLMLMVSELAEAMEGHRKGLADDKLPHRPMIEVEMADALLRIGDLAGKLRCDLGGALVEKMAFNAIRPDHKPGARMAAGGKAY